MYCVRISFLCKAEPVRPGRASISAQQGKREVCGAHQLRENRSFQSLLGLSSPSSS